MNTNHWILFIKKALAGFLTLSGLLLVSGCINLEPVEDTTKFYVLAVERDGFSGTIDKRIAVRSVDLVDYLENSQIMQRSKGNEISYLNGHRWAGDLDLMIGMVVADEIEKLLSGVYATVGESLNPDYNLDLKVLNFDITSSGNSEVILEWTIVDADTRQVVSEGRTQAFATGSSGDTSDQVAALESALREVTATIADHL